MQNEVFYRANGAKLGDVAQSIFLREGRVFIPMDNSGVIWAIDADTFRVEGKLEAASTPTRTTTSSRRATSTS